MVKGVTMAMVGGEPTLVFWRVEDFGRAMRASRDTGLPFTSPPKVADEIIERIRRVLTEDDPELEEGT
ncbi:MAG: hypothetical protein OXK77_11550 [Gemmatimonadota bacterium]|nr:hypothetical protein [Gemmatimonadota bacterium]MYB04838.1 hypothetical protein [Gemmatimonadota bacterium]MYE15313.1 hypothetical protein [Gemmatimonadota bacterium]MYG23708.1 hypothetical protein [Gemmatimonadota bacterium]MYJ40492.1 hypothetical protein [Gemmatimonadota bacterium]